MALWRGAAGIRPAARLLALVGLSLIGGTSSYAAAFATSRPTGLGFAASPLLAGRARAAVPVRASAAGRWTCSDRLGDDDAVRTKRGGKKNPLWAPATSLLSWREYRQRLVKAETPFYLRRAAEEKGIWVHELAQLERGCLLIESPHHGKPGLPNSASRCMRVVLLVKHSREGSSGLILNQPSPAQIGDLTRQMPGFAGNRIYFGGEGTQKGREGQRSKGETEMHTVHSVKGLKGGEELTDGVFVGADVLQAQHVVSLGLAKPEDFKFFYSCTRWEAGQLEKEFAEGRWIPAAASREVALKPSSHWEVNWQKPMWRILLEVMGGKHGLMAREAYGDF